MAQSDRLNDAELVACIKAKVQAEHSWRLLVQRHRLRVLAIILRNIQDRPVAQYLAQDVFLKLYEHINSDKDIDHLPALLYRMSYFLACDHIRDEYQKREVEKKMEKSWPSIVQNEAFSRLYNRDTEYLEERLRLATRDLSEIQRQVITLFYNRRLSYREIAEHLNLPVAKVRSALQNGRLKLKRLLEKPESANSGHEAI
ncbi:MAG: RNA polymerase sigma factor [Bacteroidota bacterium]